MTLLDEIADDIMQCNRMLQRRGSIDRTRLAFRVTPAEFEILQDEARRISVCGSANELPLKGFFIMGWKIIPDLPE